MLRTLVNGHVAGTSRNESALTGLLGGRDIAPEVRKPGSGAKGTRNPDPLLAKSARCGRDGSLHACRRSECSGSAGLVRDGCYRTWLQAPPGSHLAVAPDWRQMTARPDSRSRVARSAIVRRERSERPLLRSGGRVVIRRLEGRPRYRCRASHRQSLLAVPSAVSTEDHVRVGADVPVRAKEGSRRPDALAVPGVHEPSAAGCGPYHGLLAWMSGRQQDQRGPARLRRALEDVETVVTASLAG